MSSFFCYEMQITPRGTDPFNQCRPSALLELLQDAATRAACTLHVSREEMLESHHAFWMLARIWYRLDRPIFWNDYLTIKTWHRGAKGAAMYRDFDLFVNGEAAGEAISVWVLADQDTRTLLRLSNLAQFHETSGGPLCKKKILTKIRMPEQMEPAGCRQLHYSDADVNGHVNNARYADFACDAIQLERLGKGKFVSSLQVGFLKECLPGESLHLSRCEENGTWYIHGAGDAGDGRFDTALVLSPLTPLQNEGSI